MRHLRIGPFLLVGFCLSTGFAQEVSVEPAPATIESYEAGDSYVFSGKPFQLHRSVDRFAVSFRKETDKSRKQELILELDSAILDEAPIGGKRELGLVRLQPKSGEDLEQKKARLERNLSKIKGKAEVEYASPVLVNPANGRTMVPTDEIILKLKPGVDVASLPAGQELEVLRKGHARPDEYVLRLKDPKAKSSVEIANQISKSGLVQWAEPNFVQEIVHSWMPDDPLFGNQWHLNNTWDTDVDAPEAWNLTTGSSDIVIAVLDDGVEMTHEDLSPNIFTNGGEISWDGIDNDSNGYIDDYRGWDFAGNDNDPSPGTSDYHGTAVAGVAAGKGDNALGISGACPNCRILPVRLPFGEVDVTVLADAIEYAATLADVLNNSWGLSGPSNAIQSAIQWATTNGRGGKGCPVLFASGNAASGLQMRWAPSSGSYSAGTWTIRIEYAKDASGSAGDDTVWLASVYLQSGSGTYFDFESGSLPEGWTTGGTNGGTGWSIVTDPTHTDEGNYQTKAAKAGTIGDGQTSYIEFTRSFGSSWYMGTFAWVSSQSGGYPNGDRLRVAVAKSDGSFSQTIYYGGGVPVVEQAVGYPAAHPESIAIGASTDWDYRSHYSQFGPELSVLAPSSGGPFNYGIATTDRTGTSGYSTTNYCSSFGGTSSATPLASGVVGLMLSRNPDLTQAEVRQILQENADKVGPEPYSGGRNDRYGYGRINASAAVTASTGGHQLSISKAGTGGGTIISLPSGITCGEDCSQFYSPGTEVTLTATADFGSEFAGWSGAGCSGTGDCVVTMDSAKSVTATFNLATYQLAVSKSGSGIGTVTSSPPGIDCGSDCAEMYTHGTNVTLTASAGLGSYFAGWSGGGCTGTGTCDVSMTQFRAVTATFAIQTFELSVGKSGNGVVTSSPAGIDCGSDCSEVYSYGAVVDLTATASPGSTFSGWGGACTGSGTCQVTMIAARTVTATFTLTTYALTVQKAGTGTGTVTSSPSGVDCGADCLEYYDHATVVTLTAVPDPGSIFTGWSGPCSGTGECQVTMDAAKTVTASFGGGLGRAFVAASGSDTNDCTASRPCRTFAHALTVVVPRGEVVALQSGGYGSATITRSVSIYAPIGIHAGLNVESGDGLTIDAGPDDTVVLRGLQINSIGGTDAIEVQSVGTLFVDGCKIVGFSHSGISFISGGKLVVKKTSIANCGGTAVWTHGISATKLMIDDCDFSGNHVGVSIEGASEATVTNSSATNNYWGFAASNSSESTHPVLALQNVRVTGSFIGLSVESSAGTAEVLLSFSLISGNSYGAYLTGGGIVRPSQPGTNTFSGNLLDFYNGSPSAGAVLQ